MRLLPSMATPGARLPFDRDARRRGLALRVGVVLSAPAVQLAQHLEAHGVQFLWPDVASGAPDGWLAGPAAAAEAAAAAGARWLAVGEEPQGVLRGVMAAEAVAEARGTRFPDDGVGVLLASALRRGDLAPGQIGATGPTSLRTLMERYVAVGVGHFALLPVTDELDEWVHRICPEVTDLDTVGAMPCGC